MKGIITTAVATAAGLAAGLLIGLSGTAGAATAAAHTSTARCADRQAAPALARYAVTSGQSLDNFARVHGFAKGEPTDAADVLGFSYECTPGWSSPALIRYIDAHHWHAALKGVKDLWSWAPAS